MKNHANSGVIFHGNYSEYCLCFSGQPVYVDIVAMYMSYIIVQNICYLGSVYCIVDSMRLREIYDFNFRFRGNFIRNEYKLGLYANIKL